MWLRYSGVLLLCPLRFHLVYSRCIKFHLHLHIFFHRCSLFGDIARIFRERDLEVLRTSAATELHEALPLPEGGTTQFIALRFPMLSDDGVVVAVCTKLVDVSSLQKEQRDGQRVPG